MMRLKLDANQMRYKEANKTRIHMKARSSISHTGRPRFQFLSPWITRQKPQKAELLIGEELTF